MLISGEGHHTSSCTSCATPGAATTAECEQGIHAGIMLHDAAGEEPALQKHELFQNCKCCNCWAGWGPRAGHGAQLEENGRKYPAIFVEMVEGRISVLKEERTASIANKAKYADLVKEEGNKADKEADKKAKHADLLKEERNNSGRKERATGLGAISGVTGESLFGPYSEGQRPRWTWFTAPSLAGNREELPGAAACPGGQQRPVTSDPRGARARAPTPSYP
jgi:hypothetical protein